jgi:hypothetical protein
VELEGEKREKGKKKKKRKKKKTIVASNPAENNQRLHNMPLSGVPTFKKIAYYSHPSPIFPGFP